MRQNTEVEERQPAKQKELVTPTTPVKILSEQTVKRNLPMK